MSFVAVAVGGAAIAGSMYSAHQAGKAADAQVDASRDASDQQMAMFEQTRQDQMPWMNTGKQALNRLAALQGIGTSSGGPIGFLTKSNPEATRAKAMEQFQASPGYQFRLDQGMDAIQNSAAARGQLGAGNTLKAIQGYGQGLASEEFNNYTNRLSALAGVGQTAATNLGTLGANAAGQAGNATMAAGAARASGYVGQANAVNGGLNQLSQLGGYMNWGGGGGGSSAPANFNLSSMYR